MYKLAAKPSLYNLGISKVIIDVLKSIKIKDYSSKIDLLRQELEGLIELSPSEHSRKYIVEKVKKLDFVIKNITPASDPVLKEQYAKAINVLHDVISEVQEQFDKISLIPRNRELINYYFSLLEIHLSVQIIGKVIDRIKQTQNLSEQVMGLTSVYELYTEFINKHWNTPHYNSWSFVGFLARGAVELLSKNIQEGELKTEVRSDILANLQKASEELIFTTLTVQERKIEILQAKSDPYSNITPPSEQDTESLIAMMKGWQTEYSQEEMHESL